MLKLLSSNRLPAAAALRSRWLTRAAVGTASSDMAIGAAAGAAASCGGYGPGVITPVDYGAPAQARPKVPVGDDDREELGLHYVCDPVRR